jgi:hypothetical protein
VAPAEQPPSQTIEYNSISHGGWTASAQSVMGPMTALGGTQDEARSALETLLNLARSYARRLSPGG